MKNWIRIGAVAVVVSLLAGACGDDSDDNANSDTPNTSEEADTSAPTSGGTLTIGVWAEAYGFDPILHNGSALAGGMELIAVYDQLIRWNPKTREYDPGTARSVEANDDFTEWTIELRPGITFGDGEPYNAEAVRYNIERQKTESVSIRGYLSSIENIEVVDDLTLRITLAQPWSAFRSMLAGALSLIVSPTTLERIGADQLQHDPQGAGAGPYEVQTFRPGETIVLTKRAGYWGEEPYLDELRFVNHSSGSIAYEAFKAGEIDVAMLRDPAAVVASRDDEVDGIDTRYPVGEMYVLNNGVKVTCKDGQPAPVCSGKADGTSVATETPGADPDVRKAIQLALDLDAIDVRANEGNGAPANSLFGAGFPWDPDVKRPAQDVEEAKRLVERAKSRGWDGSIRITCNTDSKTRSDATIAVSAALNAVGIEVESVQVPDTSVIVRQVITLKDFDLACWGLTGTPDEWFQANIDVFLRSTSASNRVGYSNPEMDDALDDLKVADSDEARTDAYRRIATLWYEEVPSVILSHSDDRLIWKPNVHGIRGASLGNAVFDRAWIEN